MEMGIVIGGEEGFIGGREDKVIMRIKDVFIKFKKMVMDMLMVGMIGKGMVNVIIEIEL